MTRAEEIRKSQKEWTKKDERQFKKIYKKMKRKARKGQKQLISSVSLRPKVKAKLEGDGFSVAYEFFGCVIKW